MKVMHWITALVFVLSAFVLQKSLVNARFSFVLNNPQCQWCLESDDPDRVDYIPYDTVFLKLAAPADNDLLADLLWLRTSYYFGSHAITDQSYSFLDFLLQRITDLSPKWEMPYLAGTAMLLYEAREPVKAVKLITKGMDALPDVWEFPFLKGYVFWKQFNDYEAASHFFFRASQMKHSPVYLSSLASRFRHKAGQDRIDKIFSDMMDRNLKDPIQKDVIYKRLKEM